jgi:predicted MFS family arabinose efflux permease
MVGTSFMLLLNIYLRKLGQTDAQIGATVSFQYAGGLLLSLPMGLFLRGRRLKPFLLAGAVLVPILALLVLVAFRQGEFTLGRMLLLLLSMAMLQLESFSLPYIIRSQHKESEPEAISLAYSAHSAATILSGILILLVGYLLPKANWAAFSGNLGGMEFIAMSLIACTALPAVFLVAKAKERAPDLAGKVYLRNLGSLLHAYDWLVLAKALTPTFILAVGAGLTIPFVNLYFNSVFGLDSGAISLLGMATSALVFVAALTVPAIRRRHGYMVAITLVQCLAVLMLMGLACTELFAHLPWMVVVAVGFYMLRGPLMNMAGPMGNELVMNYVGPRNQDLAGALHASLWSGGWFVSARIFEFLRGEGLPYYQIFLLTAGMYWVAILLYYLLIRDYTRRLRP